MTTTKVTVQTMKGQTDAVGVFTSGAWHTRGFKTVLTNEITGASLGSNQITLPAGTYYIEAAAPYFSGGSGVRRNMAKLRNITDSSDVLLGASEYSIATPSGTAISGASRISGRFTIESEKDFEIQHQCETTRSGNGFGSEVNSAFTVPHETYTDVKIWKVGL